MANDDLPAPMDEFDRFLQAYGLLNLHKHAKTLGFRVRAYERATGNIHLEYVAAIHEIVSDPKKALYIATSMKDAYSFLAEIAKIVQAYRQALYCQRDDDEQEGEGDE